MQKIVTIGGGTGHFQILKGLKNYDCEITAIVNMSDDGGSSGRLRDEYGVLPPGDVRQCIVALAHENGGRTLRDLFAFRLKDGHSLGNLIITALTEITGSQSEAIKVAGKLLNVNGYVLPVTLDDCKLVAETEDGRILEGESKIYNLKSKTKLKRIYHEPKSFLFREAAIAIRQADKIIVCPGDLYASIIPNFLANGMSQALSESRAKKIYVCNLFTKQSTYDFKVSDFVNEIEKYSGIRLDKILINNGEHNPETIKKYFSEESKLVEDDLFDDLRVVRDSYAMEYASGEMTILRHMPERIAHKIIDL